MRIMRSEKVNREEIESRLRINNLTDIEKDVDWEIERNEKEIEMSCRWRLRARSLRRYRDRNFETISERA